MPTSLQQPPHQPGVQDEVPVGPGVYLCELTTPMQEATNPPEKFYRHANRLLNPPWPVRILIGSLVWILGATIYRNSKPDKFQQSE